MKNAVYQAGVARADITPEIGIRLIGYAVREGVSHSVDMPMSVTALALRGRSPEETVILLAADVAVLMMDYGTKVREACGAAVGLPASNILINCNHSHSSPMLPGYLGWPSPEQERLEEYAEVFLNGCLQACREAMTNMQPARLAVGWGDCKGNINRRQKSPDGETLLGENPDGACDTSVGVLRVDDLAGRPLAVAFRYSCHTVTLGPKTNVISPDWAGTAREVVESALGCPALFLQGCAGNINPASGIGQDADTKPNFKDDKERLGHRVGGEVLQVAQGLRTHRERAEPRLVQSVAVYWWYESRDIAPGPPGSIQVKETAMRLPLAPFPALAEVRAERELWAAKLQAGVDRGDSQWVINPLIGLDMRAAKRLAAAESGPNPLPVDFTVQTIRIGDFNIVAMPFEPMTETGLALRAALGDDTFVLGYSNGMISYLPTPEVSAEGGMESRLAYKAYLVESEVPGDWEPLIREQIVRQLQA